MALNNGASGYKGKSLSITIDDIEYNMDADNIVLDSEDLDTVTFAQLAEGGKQWFFTIEALQDFGTGSLWNYIWSQSGTKGVAFTFNPYGNATATAAQPHFTGTLTIGDKPTIGGGANDLWTFSTRFDVDGVPTLVTTGS